MNAIKKAFVLFSGAIRMIRIPANTGFASQMARFDLSAQQKRRIPPSVTGFLIHGHQGTIGHIQAHHVTGLKDTHFSTGSEPQSLVDVFHGGNTFFNETHGLNSRRKIDSIDDKPADIAVYLNRFFSEATDKIEEPRSKLRGIFDRKEFWLI